MCDIIMRWYQNLRCCDFLQIWHHKLNNAYKFKQVKPLIDLYHSGLPTIFGFKQASVFYIRKKFNEKFFSAQMGHNYIETKIIHANYFCLLSLNWLPVHYSFLENLGYNSPGFAVTHKKPSFGYICVFWQRKEEKNIKWTGEEERGQG